MTWTAHGLEELHFEKVKQMKSTHIARAAIATFLLGAAPCLAKAETAKAPTAKVAVPDISGLWTPVGSSVDITGGINSTGADATPSGIGPPFGSMPTLKGKYLESFQKRKKMLEGVGSEFKTSCKVLGMPTVMVGPYAVEVMQTPTQINWAQEYLRETRRFYLDGRSHPDSEENPPTFEGHSTGRWEGDTLVVETVNIRQETTLGESGHADDALGHSPKLRIVERIHLIPGDKLQVDGTVEDADSLIKPWHYTLAFSRAPKGDEFMEYVCEDNNAETIDPSTGAEITTIPERRNITPPKP
ncbi:MAG: hypothetical protein ABI395_09200 [Sphingobium sp.]